MGSKKRLRKQYENPKKIWDADRISSELKLVDEYGLKNTRELWRAKTILRKIRREARRLLAGQGANADMRAKQLEGRVKKYFIRKDPLTLDDILALTDRDLLGRRLQTLVEKKHLAATPHQARQFITHGHIAIAGQKVTSPSYLVPLDEEDKINWYGHAIVIQNEPDGGDSSSRSRRSPSAEEAKPAAQAA